MNKPLPPPPPEPTRGLGSWLAIGLVAMLAVIVLAGLSFLTMNIILPVVVIGGVLFLIVGFHYFVWGWWMERYIRRVHELEDEEDE